jgi:hypothetical protein
MGEQGIGLEDGIDLPFVGRGLIDQLAADTDLTRGRFGESADEIQRCGLSAARGAEKAEELSLVDLKVK